MRTIKTGLFLSICIISLFSIAIISTKAASTGSFGTTVDVGNSAPAFTSGPEEFAASDATTPTNVGSNVTFRGTASDANLDRYYLLLCTTSGAPTPGSASAPTCNGGASNQLCVSASQISGVQTGCNHTVLSSETAETQNWYAFVCDDAASGACSSSSSGAGSSGSPYSINHNPTFSAVPSTPSANPGGTVTITVPSGSWTETDVAGVADTAKLVVCDAAGLANGACSVGTQLCASSLLAPGNALSCSFSSATKLYGNYPAYTYIVDSHNLAATGVGQGANVGFNINNIAPGVSNVIINAGNNITLTANSTQSVNIKATVSDTNGCSDLAVNPVTSKTYRSGVTAAGCTSTNSSCYLITSTFCTVDSGNTCTGGTDTNVDYNCTVSMQYYTDPTDGLTATYSPYYNQNWLATVSATDLHSANGSLESSTGVEVNSINAMDISTTINYGSVGAGATSGGGLINIPVTVTNVGNVGLDTEVLGNGAGLCSGAFPTCAEYVIPLSNQKFEYLNNTTTFAAGTHSLSTTPVALSLGILKPTAVSNPTTKNIYWALSVPLGQEPASYSGSNTVNSFVSLASAW